MSKDWITVATFQHHADALLAKSLLDAAEIESWLKDEHLGRMMGSHSFAFGGIKLQVMPQDEEAALAVLQSKDSGERELSEPGE